MIIFFFIIELESTNPDIESSTAIEMNSASSSEVVTQVPSGKINIMKFNLLK